MTDPADDLKKQVARDTKPKDPQATLFDLTPTYLDDWWGMPSFDIGDARPQHNISVNFATWDDVLEFAERIGAKVTRRTDTMWFPQEDILAPSSVVYEGPAKSPKYPIFIPSKGRWRTPHTADRLKEMNCPFHIVVEPVEADKYRETVGAEHVMVLPFSNLGQGSIPARNWIWDKAIELGFERHWIIDDNIGRFYRLNLNRRIPVSTPAIFRCAEDFTDRYENVAFSGLNNVGFAKDREPGIPPFKLNTRIYSMILVNNELPYRWRGKYNEDTDICLRALKDGWVTIQFNAFLGDKTTTKREVGHKQRGGNTDTVYAEDKHRRKFAESLAEQHPDVVEVVWKFHRWHHEVDYSGFSKNLPRLKPDVTPSGMPDEYGMELRRRQERP